MSSTVEPPMDGSRPPMLPPSRPNIPRRSIGPVKPEGETPSDAPLNAPDQPANFPNMPSVPDILGITPAPERPTNPDYDDYDGDDRLWDIDEDYGPRFPDVPHQPMIPKPPAWHYIPNPPRPLYEFKSEDDTLELIKPRRRWPRRVIRPESFEPPPPPEPRRPPAQAAIKYQKRTHPNTKAGEKRPAETDSTNTKRATPAGTSASHAAMGNPGTSASHAAMGNPGTSASHAADKRPAEPDSRNTKRPQQQRPGLPPSWHARAYGNVPLSQQEPMGTDSQPLVPVPLSSIPLE